MTTPNDTNEPSPASDGSHGEPVGWQATDEFGRPSGFLSWRCGETRWPKSQTVPLYLAPQPTLTDEEQGALKVAIEFATDARWHETASVLARLADRLK